MELIEFFAFGFLLGFAWFISYHIMLPEHTYTNSVLIGKFYSYGTYYKIYVYKDEIYGKCRIDCGLGWDYIHICHLNKLNDHLSMLIIIANNTSHEPHIDYYKSLINILTTYKLAVLEPISSPELLN